MKFKISELIYKSIAKIITDDEKAILDTWLADESNKAIYDQIIDQKNIEDKFLIYKNLDTSEVYNRFKAKTHKRVKTVPRIRRIEILRYAAVAILFLGIGYFYQQGYFTTRQTPLVDAEHISLQLENGDVEIINEDGVTKVFNKQGDIVGTQKGNHLVYGNDGNEVVNKALVYNTLTVPYGKRFEITLSDGTNVHMNAGSYLRYPVNFVKGERRQVYLNGEAYFSVAKDSNHPFIVNADHLNVEVIGTKFNVAAYPEDSVADVVLVEGSVGLYADDSSLKEGTMIVPGAKATLHKENQHITTEEVNVLAYIAWMQGGMVFRNMPFKNIVKKLERHYNVKIIISNLQLNNEVFSASFKEESIEKVFSYFKDSYDINYTIKDNTIYIK